MKRAIGKLVSFVQHLLGLSVWKITNSKYGHKSVVLSKFGLAMSLFNFSIACYCFYTIEHHNSSKIFNIANFHKTELFQIGDQLLKIIFLARFYILYFSVWLFNRHQRVLYKQFIATDFYLGELKQFYQDRTPRSKYIHYVIFRFLIFIIFYTGTYSTHVTRSSKGCKMYSGLRRNPQAIIGGVIVVASCLATLFDITSCLAFIETRFNKIQQWLLILRRRNNVNESNVSP